MISINSYQQFQYPVVAPPAPSWVTTGLLSRLDAGDTNSYPGTGTTWTDLSGNNYNGSINGGTYNSGNGGSINLVSSDYVAYTPNRIQITSDFTFGMVLNASSFAAGNPGFWRDDPSLADCTGNDFFIIQTQTGRPWLRLAGGDVYKPSSGYTVPLNTWAYLQITVTSANDMKFYVNGVLQVTVSHSKVPTINLGWFGYQCGLLEKVNGNYSVIEWYNIALNQTQITQNFDLVKARYGL